MVGVGDRQFQCRCQGETDEAGQWSVELRYSEHVHGQGPAVAGAPRVALVACLGVSVRLQAANLAATARMSLHAVISTNNLTERNNGY